jgi:hypothetical protein
VLFTGIPVDYKKNWHTLLEIMWRHTKVPPKNCWVPLFSIIACYVLL